MDRNQIISLAEKFTEDSPANFVSAEVALNPEYAGMMLFDAPIFAFGAPDDEIFTEFKSPEVIGEQFLLPHEFMPSAQTVISFFLPFTDQIRSSNAENNDWPSDEWLHGRYEGQNFLNELCVYLQEILLGAGFESLVPSHDPRYKMEEEPPDRFTSNWSERHVAHACGLGTFGLSKGLITRKGICGRFGSVLTDLDLPKDKRPYADPYEYCTMCGSCAVNCPVDAISVEGGKEHLPCSAFLGKVRTQNQPRYGCGKCQVNVPCENEIP